jgi:ABC-2 type transport system permease protein
MLLLYFLISITSVYFGSNWLEKHDHYNTEIEQQYLSEIEYRKEHVKDLDPGYAAYYLFMPTKLELDPWAALFPGEFSEFVANLRIRLLSIQSQIYSSEIKNHTFLQTGKLDLSFVWIYLLPLLIDVLCVNIIAEEKSNGRWYMLASSASTERGLIFRKLLLRFIVLSIINLFSFFIASFLVGLQFDIKWITVFLLLTLYQFFWFVVVIFILNLNKKEIYNALMFFSLWLLFSVLIPWGIYLSQMNAEDLENKVTLLIEQRQFMNDSWDMDKQFEFDKYLQRHHEWTETSELPDTFHWKWYYAMQHASDEIVAEAFKKHRETMFSNINTNQSLQWMSPVINMQMALNHIANTGYLTYQGYIDQVLDYHKELQEFYFPYFFFDKEFSVEHLDSLPRFKFQQEGNSLTMTSVTGLVITILIFLIFIGLTKTFYRRI